MKSGLDQFFTDVAADPGTGNYLPVLRQYNDSSGHFAASTVAFGGEIGDANAHPTTDGCPAEVTGTCLSGHQLISEVESCAAEHHLPLDTSHDYCGYHESDTPTGSTGTLLFAEETYEADNANCRGATAYPDGSAGGEIDASTAHELAESITDPLVENGATGSRSSGRTPAGLARRK